ncbi:hypothetical protein CA850_20865 [Micromonospora echinospora]|uniref:Methionyl-tRNA synthetase n=1 Tax=Micromonospora echinospora TaxID=1877 RepID=A0A1C4WFE4_MICEC|nr:hypothetical protein [Micromonospora echinospora]OZV77860.1 hypothetical protein CA850_20865 [Micromonospora echinospora]SCE94918.1 hypothetical protein GA0070618_2141 [Micromonospora echinospora]
MIAWEDREPSTVLLAPPSPPGAPHLGGIYTWVLLDAARRTAQYFGGDAHLPQSWNMASRRLEPTFGHDPEEFARYCGLAVDNAVATLEGFGIAVSPHAALRDDDASVRALVQAVITDLANSDVVRYLAAEEKWCLSCRIALPPSADTEHCFTCGGKLRVRTTWDWFLPVDLDEVFRRAATVEWVPGYGIRRLRSLADVHPLIRVGHPRRNLGVPSPLHDGEILDPRLVGALGPSLLRRLGLDGPIVAAAGFDIQRKWLLTLLAANRPGALPAVIVQHGTLLDTAGRKLSRYTGASLADAPADVEPCLVRAALLSSPLGKDLRATALATVGASRLREKVLNSLRYIGLQQPRTGGIDLDAACDELLSEVESQLKAFDVPRAYAGFLRAVLSVSSTLIPMIRRQGMASYAATCRRIVSLHGIFYGDDPRLPGMSAGLKLRDTDGGKGLK